MSTVTHGTPSAGARTPTGDAARRRLIAVLLLVLSLAGIGIVSLGAAADRGPETVYSGSTEGEYRWAPKREPYTEPDWSTGSPPPPPEHDDGGGAGLISALVVGGAVLLLLIVLVLYRMWKLNRPAPALADLSEEIEEELSAVQARAALEEARIQLSTIVDAHDAVIAAWLSLERAIAEAGVRRAPTQTTLEFVVAVLGSLSLDRSALDRLAHLSRRALFDPQPLVEEDRDEALALLDRLTAQLDRGTDPAAGPSTPGRQAR